MYRRGERRRSLPLGCERLLLLCQLLLFIGFAFVAVSFKTRFELPFSFAFNFLSGKFAINL
jgi:hypothetical protein